MLRFWDEIFPWDNAWVDEFAANYKTQIGIPFEIWGHPRLSAGRHIKTLTGAGLSKIEIGVQSGCPDVRKDVYNRNETEDEIIKCSQSLSEAKVPIVIYDFILGHPFETEKDLSETLGLCRKLAKPFQLQLHGLSFLPGTHIEDIAVSRGVKTWDEIRAEQARPLREQYRAMHWWRRGRGGEQTYEKAYWYTLIYLTQFKSGELIIKWALKKDKLKQNAGTLLLIQRFYNYAQIFKAGSRKLGYMVKKRFSNK
jgi:coproporphyrinogen III oxidase-like Fe-S oxidoreductase